MCLVLYEIFVAGKFWKHSSIHVYLYTAIAKINLLGRLNKKKKKRSPVKTTDLASSMLLNKCLMTPDLQMKCIFGLTKVHTSHMPECKEINSVSTHCRDPYEMISQSFKTLKGQGRSTVTEIS